MLFTFVVPNTEDAEFVHFIIHIWAVAKQSAWTQEKELIGKDYYRSKRIFLCKNKAKLRICKTCGISQP